MYCIFPISDSFLNTSVGSEKAEVEHYRRITVNSAQDHSGGQSRQSRKAKESSIVNRVKEIHTRIHNY